MSCSRCGSGSTREAEVILKVLVLCSYPIESAATRFRVMQFIRPLADQGIELTVLPFLSGEQFRDFYSDKGTVRKAVGLLGPLRRRFAFAFGAARYDLLLVQREAMFFGPAIFEWLYHKIGNVPMVLDLDDATYVSYVSPSYGKLGSFFKFFGKTDSLIQKAALVVCGNRFIAEYAASKGAETIVIPTVADTGIFSPVVKNNELPVLGWIGTHSTLPFLESIFPVLEKLAKDHEFKLRIVGAGKTDIKIAGVEVENRVWRLESEPEEFQTLDIGLYPIALSSSANEQWLKGKSGFKAIQYLAVGVPFVMSPVGVCAEIGQDNVTHFNAVTNEDWYNSLSRLIADPELRNRMGKAGRDLALADYTVPTHARALAEAMKRVAAGRNAN